MIKVLFPWLFILIPLTACQSTSTIILPTTTIEQFYLDKQFNTDSIISIESEQDVFQIDDKMRKAAKSIFNVNNTMKENTQALLEYIFSKNNIAITYSKNANLTATQAFHSQQANCMSLTIMAYALAKEGGLSVDFQQVKIPEYWVRHGRYSMLTGHVNLLVKPNPAIKRIIFVNENNLQIDFDPYVLKQRFAKKIIQKNTVLAMYYNNKGAEAMVNENFSKAYQYLKTATLVDNTFSSAWGNLGILYRLTGNLTEAELVYRFAAQLDGDNLTVLENLAILLNYQNKNAEAKSIENRIYQERINNPYYMALLADEAFYEKDYLKAKIFYKKAIRLNRRVHEFYFGLAKVYYKTNELALAQNAIKRAIHLNRITSTQVQYIAKLAFLNSLHTSKPIN